MDSSQLSYFIIDKAQQPDIGVHWYQHDTFSEGVHFMLFSGTKYAQLEDVGPQLFAIDQDHPVCQVMEKLMEASPIGCRFSSHLSIDEVIARCHWMLQIETDFGPALNRFYEPRAMQATWEVLGEEHWWRYWQIAQQVSWFDEEWHQLKRPETLPVSAEAPEKSFVILQQQFDEIDQHRAGRFVSKMTAYYQSHLPEGVEPESWVAGVLEVARQHEMATRELQEAWLRTAITEGEHFMRRPDIAEVLAHTEYIPSQRWQHVQQLLSGLPGSVT
ncbi:DUF4123 domain-containing protein [Amphritea pacifica]|uniref:DUF4123 domain-containing protein n=1 Tax=Amphritea pacifica TaxID=2811233 RepID=A0ABS2W5L7_9GAMM|nr:DUF4123 domain-containing protein [Amphritea pacifica]MBN0986921.1 DUF4123 domain-containing protein [Amphritea pacifica]